jgi:SAM-dependent methyltransferase
LAETRSSTGAREAYDPSFFENLAAAEDRHFWFRARNRVIEALAAQLTAGFAPGYRVLEVGCGTGSALRALERACPGGSVLGMDLFGEGLRHARRRGGRLVQADLHHPPFAARFDLVGLFDVVEHLADDVRVLRDLAELLAPGGALLLTVPASRRLWSSWDETVRHRRRYEPAELGARLREAGYRVEYLTPYMSAIFPLVWARRKLGRGGRSGCDADSHALAEGEFRVVPGLNALLGLCLAPEARRIARRRTLPFGTSLVAVARKP